MSDFAQGGLGSPQPIHAGHLMRELAAYRDPSTVRSHVEILLTAGPLVLLWAAMGIALWYGQTWLYLALVLPTAAFLVRIFMIQHDCGHGSFFRTRRAHDWVGRAISVVTLTPYDYWRRTHAAHHAGAGNLDRRGMGDITTLTVAEYLSLSRWQRFCYRVYRNPLVLFGIGPFYLFFVQNRFPSGLTRAGWQPWISAMATNAGILVVSAGLIWLLGLGQFLLLHIPVTAVAASIGVWLFYIQHQFEETHWAEGQDWDAREAALHGSSHYDLPVVLRWLTANIGVHHVHHLASRIPFYRLGEVLRDYPELQGLGRITLLQSFQCVRLALWDAGAKRLISFGEMRRAYAA